jgi:hypothetical protein
MTTRYVIVVDDHGESATGQRSAAADTFNIWTDNAGHVVGGNLAQGNIQIR